MGNWIEPAKTSRSKCVTCDQVIEKGTARLSEETHDIGIPTLIHRYYHPRCALATVPDVLRRALGDVRGDVVIEDRAMLEAKLAERLARETAQRKERYAAQQAAERLATSPKVAIDPVTFDLTEQLLDHPDDRDGLGVLADQLQRTGDPRGELIALQLALAAAGPAAELLDDGDDDDDEDDDEDDEPLDDRALEIQAQLRRRRVLLERLKLPLDPNDGCVWGIGFVRRLQLVAKTATRMSELAAIWRNPSLRLLSELQITFSSEHDAGWIARLVELVPRSLRRLELTKVSGAGLAELVAALPRLTSLSVSGRASRVDDGEIVATFDKLAHPTLGTLELGLATGQPDLGAILPQLGMTRLPALTELVLRPSRPEDTAAVCELLAASGWLGRLTHLGFHGGAGDGILQLANGLRGRKLARLDLTGTPVLATWRDQLGKLADELVIPQVVLPAQAGQEGDFVRHRNKPEWGRGRVVRRFADKLEVEFAEGGTKVFRADAPFLQPDG